MKKIMIAVDGTRGSKAVLSVFRNLIRPPEEVVLLHVEKLQGRSMIIDMLGEAELNTLREMLTGTEHKEALDAKAERILEFYKSEIEKEGVRSVKSIVRDGKPEEEILKAAEEEQVEFIILGHSGRRGINRLITGCVAKHVERNAKVPVLVARRTVVCEQEYSWKDAYAAISMFTVVFLGLYLLGVFLR